MTGDGPGSCGGGRGERGDNSNSSIEPFERAVVVRRGDAMESCHYAAIALVDTGGGLHAFLGDPDVRVVFRSSMKFLQAIPFFEEGLHEKLGLTRQEQAILVGSHSGQKEHVEAVLSVMGKGGVGPEHLKCGRHRPYHLRPGRLL